MPRRRRLRLSIAQSRRALADRRGAPHVVNGPMTMSRTDLAGFQTPLVIDMDGVKTVVEAVEKPVHDTTPGR